MANPKAHSGKALSGLEDVRRGLEPALDERLESALSGCRLRVEEAASAEDARRTVVRTADARALLVLGGDGAVHNVVNAMMALPVDARPMLGVLPAGAVVFVASGIDQLLHHLQEYAYTGDFDGRAVQGRSITFAVQVGQYYGGGFRICPKARMDDGAFDVCVSHPPAGPLRAVEVFLRAKNAHHTRSKRISFDRAAHIHLRFDPEPAVQVDGEPLHGTEFDVSTVPGALRVLVPKV